MQLKDLSQQYRLTADRLEARIEHLREQYKKTLGQESLALEARISALYAELLDLRKTGCYLTGYYQKENWYGYKAQS